MSYSRDPATLARDLFPSERSLTFVTYQADNKELGFASLRGVHSEYANAGPAVLVSLPGEHLDLGAVPRQHGNVLVRESRRLYCKDQPGDNGGLREVLT